MPADTSRAIGAVTELLAAKLRAHTSLPAVTSGRPEPGPDQNAPHLNLFLYEALPDPSLRTHALDEGRPAPVWLILRYLVTAFAANGESDSSTAHRSLGEAIRALHDLAYLAIDGLMSLDDEVALRASPEPLKLTFVPASAELLGRIMQGSEEKYRCSVAIEVRPVMIASAAPTEDALLVGVRYRPAPPNAPPPGVHIALDAAIAPALARAVPATFAAGDPLRLIGTGFGAGDTAHLGVASGSLTAPITATAGALVATFGAAGLRAGVLPLSVGRELASGRIRRSEPILVRAIPTLATATVASTAPDLEAAEPGRFVVELALTGELLGAADDDALVALWAGRTVASSGDLTAPPPPGQTARTATIRNVPAGTYRVIVRVNGGQAAASPEVTI